MTLCPIALAVGCRKCPIFKMCPVKSVIGDYHPPAPEPEHKPRATPTKTSGKKARSKRGR
jgi:hypothetical protein